MLESTSIEGRSGLDILIQTWCENAETFQGFWPLRLSTVALTQLFVSQRPSLQSLMVKGDLIIRPETKNVPQEFTSISFPVKALKLVLRDLHSGGEAAVYSTIGNEAYDVDVDSDDEDWQDDGVAGGAKEDEFAYLSDLIGPKGVTFDNDEVLEASDDEDLKSDEISQMDIQAYLLNFFRECATRNTNNFSHLVDQMTAEEIQVIRSVVEQQQKEQ
ncbi:hypothetical protein ONZ45_g11446 [Pleurotus djamor]|nr:hypothetical protein ONZ45_g11446 [Pleurotus djamor]